MAIANTFFFLHFTMHSHFPADNLLISLFTAALYYHDSLHFYLLVSLTLCVFVQSFTFSSKLSALNRMSIFLNNIYINNAIKINYTELGVVWGGKLLCHGLSVTEWASLSVYDVLWSKVCVHFDQRSLVPTSLCKVRLFSLRMQRQHCLLQAFGSEENLQY